MSVVSASSEGAWICEQLQEWGAAREPRALPALVALLRVDRRCQITADVDRDERPVVDGVAAQ
jgi:hypothetical protein